MMTIHRDISNPTPSREGSCNWYTCTADNLPIAWRLSPKAHPSRGSLDRPEGHETRNLD